MAKRRFEMYHYRQALVRMRLGDSDRQIAKSGLMGRHVAGTVRKEASVRGWLDTDQVLPPDEELAAVFAAAKKQRARQTSSLEPHRKLITKWFDVSATQNPRLFAAVPLWSENHSILNGSFRTTAPAHGAMRAQA